MPGEEQAGKPRPAPQGSQGEGGKEKEVKTRDWDTGPTRLSEDKEKERRAVRARMCNYGSRVRYEPVHHPI